jgi:hypothetical protein
MRYFSNFLEDRRVLISSPSVGFNKYQLRSELTKRTSLSSATANTTGITSSNTNTGTSDLFTTAGSNTSKILASIDNTTEWTKVNAVSPKTEAERKFEQRYGTEIPRNEDGSVNTAAIVQAVVDYHVKDGLNAEGFSPELFANADHDTRMSMLRSMREQNEVEKAAKFEEDMRLAMERDAAAKAAAINTQPAQNGTAVIVNGVMQIAEFALKAFGGAA